MPQSQPGSPAVRFEARAPSGSDAGFRGQLWFDTSANYAAYVFHPGTGWEPTPGGASGSFTAQSGETVTVVNGIITAITGP